MGKKSFSTITAAECENILLEIQKEFELKQQVEKELCDLKEEISIQVAQRNILLKKNHFNEKHCILCCSTFNLLFRRKVLCNDCSLWVCRSCASWENSKKTWICEVCEKQRLIDGEAWRWFYSNIKSRFKYFGRAKVLEGLCRKRASDSENDSGYGPTSDFRPLISLFAYNSKQQGDMAASSLSFEDEDDGDMIEEEEEAEIHHSIETIIEGLLGSTLDDASVDRVYTNSLLYENLFSTFHNQLIEAIRNLSLSLKRALHNMPHENDITPTTAHAALKRLICLLIQDSECLPYLELPDTHEVENKSENLSISDVDIFSSYEGLVASAIINKVVEDNQSKFIKYDTDLLKRKGSAVEKEQYKEITTRICDEEAVGNFTELELPLQYVQVEEIEEVTKEYTDSEDDKFSSISHQSSGLHSADDLGLVKCDSESDLLNELNLENDVKIAFPEFGRDLIHTDEKNDDDNGSIYHPVIVSSWQDNWLFRKKKRVPLYSNLKYQLLTYCDEPPYMLIPCPSENSGTLEPDELSSELSESHSIGSIEFSSDSDGPKSDSVENPMQDLQSTIQSIQHDATHMVKLETGITVKAFPDKKNETIDTKVKSNLSNSILEKKDKVNKDSESLFSVQKTSYHGQRNTQTVDNSAEVTENCHQEEESINGVPSHVEPNNMSDANLHSENEDETEDNCYGVPPRPGTIADREHKKWLNAVPLKNNPYSAENISKRYRTQQKSILKEHASSFKEFEKKLKESSPLTITEPFQKKLDCGLKSIDKNLYKRDYYVNSFNNRNERDSNISQYNSLPDLVSCNPDCYDGIPEETLNSFEEKVYISSGKVFTLENHIKRLERELKDSSLSSTDSQSALVAYNYDIHQPKLKRNSDNSSSDNELNQSLPSVKTLANKFVPHSNLKQCQSTEDMTDNHCKVTEIERVKKSRPCMKQCQLTEDMNDSHRKVTEIERVKKSRPCMKVHSLTARSLSREFRDMAKLNLPKPLNRMSQVPIHINDDTCSEQENACSPSSAPSPLGTVQPDTCHGYTSDESSTSTSSLPKPKTRRHISRSILQRATYWERRAEMGLLSDASVSEEFPGLEASPD